MGMIQKLGHLLDIFDPETGRSSFSKVMSFIVIVAALVYIPLGFIDNDHVEMVLLVLVGGTLGADVSKSGIKSYFTGKDAGSAP